MKKIVIIILLIFGVFVASSGLSFSDVSKKHPYYKAIKQLSTDDVIS